MQKIKERGGKVEFDYFYNRDGDRFSYYMLTKIIVTDERFKNLSSDAKILYSCLLERTSCLLGISGLMKETEYISSSLWKKLWRF